MAFSPNAATVYQDGPSIDPYEPSKPQIRELLTSYETVMDAFTTNAGLIFTSLAAMNAAAPSYTEPRSAWLFDGANSGVYVLDPTTDTWMKVGRLPYDFVIGTDLGAGTADAIQITTDIPASDGMIVAFELFESTSSSPVTISINGGTALTLKTNRGNNASALTAGMDIWGRYRSSDSTLRLLNDQDVSALVEQAEAAAVAAEAAQAAAEAAAAGVNLPSAVAGTYLRQKADLSGYETVTTDELRDDLDYLKGFNADGVADDKPNFTALEAKITGRTIDLYGMIYFLGDGVIPSGNNYINGFWARSNGEAVNPITIFTPAADTVLHTAYVLASDERYNSHPQDKARAYKDILFIAWTGGRDHVSNDIHIMCARSFDGGRTYQQAERLFQVSATNRNAFHHEIMDGQQCFIVRDGDIPTQHHLYLRRVGYLEEKVTADLVAPTAGGTAYQFLYQFHGCRSGNTFRFKQAVTIGGGTIPANTLFTGTNGTPSRIHCTGPVSAGAEQKTITVDVEWIESSGWTEITFGGVALGSHLIATVADQSGQPTMFHGGFADPGTGGTLFTHIHGGSVTPGPSLVKLTGLLGNSPAIAFCKKISTASRNEATSKRLKSNIIGGFARTQFADNSPMAWIYNETTDTFTTAINGPVGWFQYSPFPFDVDPATGLMLGHASFNRAGTKDITGNYQKGPVMQYWFEANVDDFIANRWGAVRFYELANAYKYSKSSGINAVGVGSVIFHRGEWHLFFSTDKEDQAKGTGQPQLKDVVLHPQSGKVSKRNVQRLAGIGSAGEIPAPIIRDKMLIEQLQGSNAPKYVFTCSAAGTASDPWTDHGVITPTHTLASGVYVFPAPGPNYKVIPMIVGDDVREARVTQRDASTFTITVKRVLTGAVEDGAFDLLVWVKNDLYRIAP
jgi:hypothetical protein